MEKYKNLEIYFKRINVKGEYVYFVPNDFPFFSELKQKVSELLN